MTRTRLYARRLTESVSSIAADENSLLAADSRHRGGYG
jgi:hypothetical protein